MTAAVTPGSQTPQADSKDQARILVIGNGGLARECAQLASVVRPGATVVQLSRAKEDRLDDLLAKIPPGLVILGLGRPHQRLSAWDRLRPVVGDRWSSLVHPRADVGHTTQLGEAVMVASGVVTTCDIEISDGVLLNYNVTVGHDARIGECAVVNPGATVSGGVSVGRGVLIGTGAHILEGVSIGDGAVIGAGAVVTKNVPTGATYVGVPARELRS